MIEGNLSGADKVVYVVGVVGTYKVGRIVFGEKMQTIEWLQKSSCLQ